MNRLTGLILLSGSSPSTTNIRYLSGFTAPDPFLYLQTAAGNYLIVSKMEKERAVRQSKTGTCVYTPGELGLAGKKANDFGEQIRKVMELLGLRRVQVPKDFPAGLFQFLQKKGVAVSIRGTPVCPERSIKSREEIALLRRSQRAAVAAMKAAVGLIESSRIDRQNRLLAGKIPLTSDAVRRRINQILIEHDCAGNDTIVAGGEQATDPHERGEGPLHAGQSIILDIFPRSEKSGYWGDITRTVCRGPAPQELKKLYGAVRAAQTEALRAVKPGICADEVHKAAQAVFLQRGFETVEKDGKHIGFIHGTGHGVGLDIHERPRLGTSGETLEAGQVVTVEPGLYYPGLGGVRIEDTVVVTEAGFRYLATSPKKFELL
ncbi:MAG: aminopeptidase P family protein [Kiritimatiellales bacterium]|nr:aminopeptidase P family protein [Kiritimatiellales bacterium]